MKDLENLLAEFRANSLEHLTQTRKTLEEQILSVKMGLDEFTFGIN
jgi:hypothetical protein